VFSQGQAHSGQAQHVNCTDQGELRMMSAHYYTLQNLVSCQVQLGDLCATLNCKIGIWAIHLVKALTI